MNKLPIGLRTIKTAIAVIAAMLIADQFGGYWYWHYWDHCPL